jgi:hypothetical protein
MEECSFQSRDPNAVILFKVQGSCKRRLFNKAAGSVLVIRLSKAFPSLLDKFEVVIRVYYLESSGRVGIRPLFWRSISTGLPFHFKAAEVALGFFNQVNSPHCSFRKILMMGIMINRVILLTILIQCKKSPITDF